MTPVLATQASAVRDCPPPPYDGMLVTEADYWAFYYEGTEETYEWNNGVLEEKGVSDHLTFQVYDWFLQLLIEYLRARPIATRVGLEMAFRLALPQRTTIRRPDYALILHDNPRPIDGRDRSYDGIFDICIEGISDSSRAQQERDTIVKKAEYAAAGVREYWLLHHDEGLRAFYRLGPRGIYEPLPVRAGGVVASAALPGFRWRLTDLDRQPPLVELITDEAYRDFVRLDLQQAEAKAARERARAEQAEQAEQARVAERARAEQAEQARVAERARAEQAEQARAAERARAEQAEARAAELAARLSALGEAPD